MCIYIIILVLQQTATSVCSLDTAASHTKAAEPIEVFLGHGLRWMQKEPHISCSPGRRGDVGGYVLAHCKV